MGTFFQAWRRRQAEQQAAEWTQEQEDARHAVEELPDVLREQARRAVDTLLEGRDEEVAGALEDLDHLLEPRVGQLFLEPLAVPRPGDRIPRSI